MEGPGGTVCPAVVDLHLPDGSGIDLLCNLRAAHPSGKALTLTASLDRDEHARAREAGAAGVGHQSVGIQEISELVQRLSRGNAASLASRPPEDSLPRGRWCSGWL